MKAMNHKELYIYFTKRFANHGCIEYESDKKKKKKKKKKNRNTKSGVMKLILLNYA